MSACYYDWIAHRAARRPEAVATVNLENGRRFTCTMFNRRISALAGALELACGAAARSVHANSRPDAHLKP